MAAGFGAKVKLSVDTSSSQAFNAQIQKMVKPIKIDLSKVKVSGKIPNLTSKIQQQIDRKSYSIKINKIDCSAAVAGVQTQLRNMLSALSVSNGVNITGLKDFVGTTSDIQKQTQAMATFEARMKTVRMSYDSLSKVMKGALGPKSNITNQAALNEQIAAYDRLTAKIQRLEQSGKITPARAQALRAEALAIQQEVLALQQKTAAENNSTQATKMGTAADNESAAAKDRDTAATNRNTAATRNAAAADKAKYASAKQVATLLNQATNYQKRNTKLFGTSLGNELSSIINELRGKNAIPIDRYNHLATSLVNIKTEAVNAGKAGKSLTSIFANAVERFGTWSIITRALTLARRVITTMIKDVRELDAAMTELRKVTDETDATYATFFDQAATRAKSLGATITDTISASADFARLGYDIDEASALADAALVYKNVGDGIENISDASESVISTMQAFGVEAEDAMGVVDRFNEVGNNFAISSKGIGEALTRSSAAMAAAGNTIDETIALVAAANTIVQNPEQVGTTMKTVSMYLRAAKTEAEEAGESTDGMAGSVSELRGELLKLTGNKVDIQIDDDTFKSTYQILKEMSEVWDELTDVSQANILEMLGGKRNANVVAALLENFEVAERALATSQDSAGSALQENEKYMDSINGKLAEFNAAMESMGTSFIGSDLVKSVIEFGTGVVSVLTALSDNLGSLPATVGVVMTLVSSFKALKGQIFDVNAAFNRMRDVKGAGGGFFKQVTSFVDQNSITNTAKQMTEKWSGYLNSYYQMADTGKDMTKANAALAKIDSTMAKCVNSSKSAEEAMGKYQEKLIKSGKATEVFAQQTNSATTIAQKFGNFLKGLTGVAFQALTSMAVMATINLIVKGITSIADALYTTREEAAQAAEEIRTSYSDAITEIDEGLSTVTGFEKEFETLAHGVDDYGNNISLSAEEYARYKEIVASVVGYTPQLIAGYDAEGNAIANKNGLIEESISLLEQQRKLEMESYVSNENISTMGESIAKQLRHLELNRPNYDAFDGAINDAYRGLMQDVDWRQGMTDMEAFLEAERELNQILGINNAPDYAVDPDAYNEWTRKRQEALSDALRYDNSKRAELIELLGEEYVFALDDANSQIEAEIAAHAVELNKVATSLGDELQVAAQITDGYSRLTEAQRSFVSSFIADQKVTSDMSTDDFIAMRDSVQDLVTLLDSSEDASYSVNKLLSISPIDYSSVREYLDEVNRVVNEVSEATGISVDDILSMTTVGETIDRYEEMYRQVENRMLANMPDRSSEYTNERLSEIGGEMEEYFGGGNVDLTLRPRVDNGDGTYSTLASEWISQTIGDQEFAIHYTPIVDGEFLDDAELEEYLNYILKDAQNAADVWARDADIANGGKNILLRIQAGFDPETENAWGEALSDYQEYYYDYLEMLDETANLPETYVGGMNGFADAVEQLGINLSNLSPAALEMVFKALDEADIDSWVEAQAYLLSHPLNFNDIISTDSLSQISAVETKVTSLGESLSKLQAGEMSYSDLAELVSLYPELIEYIDLSADGFGDLDQGLRKLMNDSARSFVDDLMSIKETVPLTAEAAEQIDILAEKVLAFPSDTIGDAANNWGLYADQVRAAGIAQTELEQALAGGDYDDGFQARVDNFEAFQELVNSNKVGSRAYNAYAEYFGIDGQSTDYVRNWVAANSKYLQEGQSSVDAFLTSIQQMNASGKLDSSVASFIDGYFKYDINQLEEFAAAFGWTTEMLQDMIGNTRMYMADFLSRTPGEAYTELFNNDLFKNIDVGDAGERTIAYMQELMDYTGLTEDGVISLIESINELLALEGKDPIELVSNDGLNALLEWDGFSYDNLNKSGDEAVELLQILRDQLGFTYEDFERIRDGGSEAFDELLRPFLESLGVAEEQIDALFAKISGRSGAGLLEWTGFSDDNIDRDGKEAVALWEVLRDEFDMTIGEFVDMMNDPNGFDNFILPLLEALDWTEAEIEAVREKFEHPLSVSIGAEIDPSMTPEEVEEKFSGYGITISASVDNTSLNVTQETVDTLLAETQGNVDEALGVLAKLSETHTLNIDPSLEIDGQNLQEALDTAIAGVNTDESAVTTTFTAEFIIDEQSVTVVAEGAANSFRNAATNAGAGYEVVFTADGGQIEQVTTDAQTLQGILSQLDADETIVTVSDTTGMVRSNLQSVVNWLDAISRKNMQTITIKYVAIGDVPGHTATGTRYAHKGPSLLGDEYSATGTPKPELVVSKDGYAYVAGINGPTLGYLNEGDVVYTNSETKRILGNGYNLSDFSEPIQAFGGGTYEPYRAGTYSRTQSSNATVTVEVDDKDLSEQLEDTISKLEEEFDEVIGNYEHSIFLMEKHGDSYYDMIAVYRAMQQAAHEQAEEYRKMGLDENSDYIQELQKQWWEYEDEIKELKEQAVEDLLDIVEAANDAVDEIQKIDKALHDAAKEYSENGGFISVDTYQELMELSPALLQYLYDENGQLVINEDRINAVIRARTRQLSVETAMAYVERLRLALNGESLEDLNQLLYDTTEATDATWGLVYANLALLDLNADQFQTALENIERIRALGNNAAAGVAITSDATKESIEETRDSLDEILDYTMDMLKQNIDDQVESLEEMKESYAKIIELKKESLRASQEESDYQDEVEGKVKEIAKLQERINRLSLDDSRSAYAERVKLEEEMAELQKELAKTQADHSLTAQEESLDKMQEAYDKEIDSEIEALQNSISSYQKLYDMAIQYINDNWSTLYDELISWNTEYGSVLNSEITGAWENALEAAMEYGSFVEALDKIGSGDTGSSNQSGNNVVGESGSNTNEDFIISIIKEMYKNSKEYGSATAERKAELDAKNLELGKALEKFGIKAIRSNGVWYIDKVGGAKLYDTYMDQISAPDIVAANPRDMYPMKDPSNYLPEPIVGAGMEEDEVRTAFKKVDLSGIFAEKFGKAIDLSGISNIISSVATNLLDPVIGSQASAVEVNEYAPSTSIAFGDVNIYGANSDTVEEHRKVTRQFTNEILKQLNIKR